MRPSKQSYPSQSWSLSSISPRRSVQFTTANHNSSHFTPFFHMEARFNLWDIDEPPDRNQNPTLCYYPGWTSYLRPAEIVPADLRLRFPITRSTCNKNVIHRIRRTKYAKYEGICFSYRNSSSRRTSCVCPGRNSSSTSLVWSGSISIATCSVCNTPCCSLFSSISSLHGCNQHKNKGRRIKREYICTPLRYFLPVVPPCLLWILWGAPRCRTGRSVGASNSVIDTRNEWMKWWLDSKFPDSSQSHFCTCQKEKEEEDGMTNQSEVKPKLKSWAVLHSVFSVWSGSWTQSKQLHYIFCEAAVQELLKSNWECDGHVEDNTNASPHATRTILGKILLHFGSCAKFCAEPLSLVEKEWDELQRNQLSIIII